MRMGPSDRTKGIECKLEHRKFYPNMRRNGFYFRNGGALEEAAQIGGEVIHNMPGCHSMKLALGEPALTEG